MSYTKTTWSENDIITADKLNNIEEGVSSNSLSIYEIKLTAEEFNEFSSNSLGKTINKEIFDNIRNSFLLIVSQEGTTPTDETYLQVNFVRTTFQNGPAANAATFISVQEATKAVILMVTETNGEYSLSIIPSNS